MFVCICHALSDHDVKEARQSGVANEREVFEHFGVRMNCGRCVETINDLLGLPEKASDGVMHKRRCCKLDDSSDDVA